MHSGLSAKDKKAGAYSNGMKKRLGFKACSSPPLLLLDEPTSGLDPAE